MSNKKSKSRKDSMNALANMGANMSAMLSGGASPADSLVDNTEGPEIEPVETAHSSAPSNPAVTDKPQETLMQSAENAECNGVNEMETPSSQEGEPGMDSPKAVEVNIDIDKTQGNAIYSSLLGLQNTLDNFQLDVKQEPLREVVYAAIKDAIEEHLTEEDKAQLAKEEKLRSEGHPGTVLEAYQLATQQNTEAINKFNKNSRAIQNQYRKILDCLTELLGRINLYPYEKPKFKDDKGHILLQSIYLYPWYCCKCIYASKHVRGFFKTVAWTIWLVCLGLLFFIARDNAILQKQQNINRYVHAYFSDNADVTMELEGIDLMFSDQEVMPMPIKDYREYMKERKREAKASRRK